MSIRVVRMCSRHAAKQLGLDQEVALNQAFVDLIHEADQHLASEALNQTFATFEMRQLRLRLRSAGPEAAPQCWQLLSCQGPGNQGWIAAMTVAPPDQRRDFLAHARHELRNSLTSILAYSEALHDGLQGELQDAQKTWARAA